MPLAYEPGAPAPVREVTSDALGALTLSITTTVLVYVAIPLAVVLVVSALVMGSPRGRQGRRYRPGRPYDFTPIWFIARPDQVSDHGNRRAQARALESGAVETGRPVPQGATGGASDRW
jgi:hypothetical protein